MAKRKLARGKSRIAKRQPSAGAEKAAPRADRPFAPGYGIVGAEDGSGLLPWTWVEGKMSNCRTFWLATIAETNHPEASQASRPHVMPVWGVWVDDVFFFSTGRNSRKGRNLATNTACTVTNDNGMEAVIVEGRAQELKDPAALERVAAVYKKKYKMDPRSMNEPIFKITPAKVFAFIEKSFPKSATRWKL
jgi:nitroimidazol reductase NimA-like FMN-containing flavoprotein (pyridoxamine 5'-phosphate oxidase superfamily)